MTWLLSSLPLRWAWFICWPLSELQHNLLLELHGTPIDVSKQSYNKVLCWLHKVLPLWKPRRESGWKMLFKNKVVTHGTGCTFEFEGDSQGTLAEEKWGHDPWGSFLPNNSSLIGCRETLSLHLSGLGLISQALWPLMSRTGIVLYNQSSAVDWESENLGSGSLGIFNIPEQKSSYPTPEVT